MHNFGRQQIIVASSLNHWIKQMMKKTTKKQSQNPNILGDRKRYLQVFDEQNYEKSQSQEDIRNQYSEQDDNISLAQIEQHNMQQQGYSSQKQQYNPLHSKLSPNINHQQEPTIILPKYSEIQRCIQLFKTIMPQTFNDQLIDKIYQNVSNCKNQNVSQADIKQRKKNGTYHTIKDKKFTTNHNPVALRDKKSEILSLNNDQEDTISQRQLQIKLFKQELLVAKSFCNRDYGYKELIQEIKQSDKSIYISKSDYQPIIERVIIRAFKEFQRITEQTCSLKSLYSGEKQRKHIILILKQCRKYFRPLVCLLIFQFIKKLYDFEDKYIQFDKDTIKKMYDAIYNQLEEERKQIQFLKAKNICKEEVQKIINLNQHRIVKQKVSNQHKQAEGLCENNTNQQMQNQEKQKLTKRKRFKHQLQIVWNLKYQKQLLQLYKITHNFGWIRDRFKNTYPHHSALFSVRSLRSQLTKIIRLSIRKLNHYAFIFKEQLPQLQKLDDNRVKTILSYLEGRPTRIKLFQLYLLQNIDITILTQTINFINNYIKIMDAQHKNYNKGGKLAQDLIIS